MKELTFAATPNALSAIDVLSHDPLRTVTWNLKYRLTIDRVFSGALSDDRQMPVDLSSWFILNDDGKSAAILTLKSEELRDIMGTSLTSRLARTFSVAK